MNHTGIKNKFLSLLEYSMNTEKIAEQTLPATIHWNKSKLQKYVIV